MSFTGDNLFPEGFNLQLFAEGMGEPAAASAAAPAEPAVDAAPAAESIPATPQPPVNPLLAWAQEEADQQGDLNLPFAAPEPVQEAPPDPEKLIMGKFKTQEDLEQSYTESQKKITEQGQALAEAQRRLQEFEAAQAAKQEPPEPQGQPQELVPQGPTPEEQAQFEEQFFNEWSDKPLETTMNLVQKVVQQAIQQAMQPVMPLVQSHNQYQAQAEWNSRIEQFTSDPSRSDFDSLRPVMAELADKMPELQDRPDAIEALYFMAKGRTQAQQPQTPEQLLQDPAFIEKIMQNEAIRNQVIQKHVIDPVKQGQPPVVMGSQPGGVAPSTPANKATSIKEGSRNLLAWLGNRGS